ncbi:MAG: peptidylprolyl isomerase [Clostridia bacterium]|nr:peptidylprolyl isomerase [Clostridia bacterium]
MHRRVAFTLMVAAILLITSGCALIVKDPEVDKLTVIIEVAGRTFLKEEVASEAESELEEQEYIYAMYGMSFDRTDPDVLSHVWDDTISRLIQRAVQEQKASEMGMDVFSSEELAAMHEEVDATYSGYQDSVKAGAFAETELTGDALDVAVAAKMAEWGYPGKEDMLEDAQDKKVLERLKAEVVKDVQVTEEEIQTDYEEKVVSEKTSYESSLSAYGTAVMQGTTVYYRPAGYRYVKNLLVKFTDEDSAAISDLEGHIREKNMELTDMVTSLASLPEDVASDTEQDAANRAEWEASKDRLDKEIADLNGNLEDTKEMAYAGVQTVIDEILAKISEGADFDALMEEFGQDSGMQASPAKEEGYLVCEGDSNWVPEFTDAAMALDKIGDISPAVRTGYGIHLLKYVNDLAEGDVPLEELKDIISEEILQAKQDAKYDAALEEWVEDAGAKIYMDRMN